MNSSSPALDWHVTGRRVPGNHCILGVLLYFLGTKTPCRLEKHILGAPFVLSVGRHARNANYGADFSAFFSILTLMIQKKKPPQWTNKRSGFRCPLVASAEVTDLHSGTKLSARISELGVGGCYVDALTPFPEGTLVKLRIIRDQGAFESNGRVVYTHANFGMGIAFTNVTSDQRSILETWIAEIISKRS